RGEDHEQQQEPDGDGRKRPSHGARLGGAVRGAAIARRLRNVDDGTTGHYLPLRSCRRLHHSKPLINRRISSETPRSTTAIAVASEYRKSSSLAMICMGTIWLLPGMPLAMKMTDPYSPTARANDNATPLSHAGNNSGKITR